MNLFDDIDLSFSKYKIKHSFAFRKKTRWLHRFSVRTRDVSFLRKHANGLSPKGRSELASRAAAAAAPSSLVVAGGSGGFACGNGRSWFVGQRGFFGREGFWAEEKLKRGKRGKRIRFVVRRRCGDEGFCAGEKGDRRMTKRLSCIYLRVSLVCLPGWPFRVGNVSATEKDKRDKKNKSRARHEQQRR